MENKETNTFSTDHYQLAAYLLSESCRLVSLDKTNPKRMVFVFEESGRRATLTEKFLSHKALVEVHRFCSAQKDLKQLIAFQNK